MTYQYPFPVFVVEDWNFGINLVSEEKEHSLSSINNTCNYTCTYRVHVSHMVNINSYIYQDIFCQIKKYEYLANKNDLWKFISVQTST